ncbi:hypothetical protein K449DRAFT_388213 [Hypoxylon sp. EC38]|nr:hypothetical protein K449DRAFT_388213 [Hypoxylon sp. EC38]
MAPNMPPMLLKALQIPGLNILCRTQRWLTNTNASSVSPQCRDHTCALYPSCTHPRADPIRGLFCEDHECADPGCRKQKYDSGGVTGLSSRTGIWCADHMCMAALTRREDCVNRRAGTATNPVYCADHELCEEAECNNFRAVRGRNRIQTRCEERECV